MVVECNYVLVTTQLGFEKLCASYLSELDPKANIVFRPRGFKGLILVEPYVNRFDFAKMVKERVPEAEKVIVADACAPPLPEKIAEVAASLALEKISEEEAFAVRTNRRGRHNFTSIDVNII